MRHRPGSASAATGLARIPGVPVLGRRDAEGAEGAEGRSTRIPGLSASAGRSGGHRGSTAGVGTPSRTAPSRWVRDAADEGGTAAEGEDAKDGVSGGRVMEGRRLALSAMTNIRPLVMSDGLRAGDGKP